MATTVVGSQLSFCCGLSRFFGRRPTVKSKHVIYQTPGELEDTIKQREAEAAMLPPGMTRQSVLMDLQRLRLYADMKRLLSHEDER
jgi:hypothetical protein